MIKKSVKFVSEKLEGAGWYVFIVILFYALLGVSYRYYVVPAIGGAFKLDIDSMKYAESWIIYLLLVVFSPKKLERPTDILLTFLFLQFLAPLLTFYGLSNTSREYLYIVLLGVVFLYILRMGPPVRMPIVRIGRSIVWGILIAGTVGVTLWMVLSGGLAYFNLDFTRVYEFRRDVGEVIIRGPMGYLNVWVSKVFGPFLLALALWKKNYFLAGVVGFLFIIWFGVSSHKAVFFYPLLVVFIWVYFRHSKALLFIPIAMVFVILFSLIAYWIFDYTSLGTMLIRRSFFIPAYLTFTYYDFFDQYEHVYWSNSILAGFIDYPYQNAYSFEIGAYLGETEMSANNSFLATGYMHAGILGVIFYGAVVGFIFRVIDSISSNGVPPWVAISAILIPGRTLLIGADLPTALLTHGLGIAILLLFLYRQQYFNRRSYHRAINKI